MNTKPHKTLCGIHPRAFVVSHDGPRFTYRFPCGYEHTEVFMIGHGALRQPAGASASRMFASYWREGQGVTFECPRCKRNATKKEKA